ncbi:hypothetical protein M6I34_16325 [Burkholderiaceae bacterium FT117]|uniref:hypothetical protein n=1 Tax=Zeimonas sediminis TaxID=2944268 RepID=UPI0023432197|nr:hypothetical protein [Zeimonas sediminis]MCM5572084.1 hypothetical protein [Zeimonas sediminis]
MKRSINLVTLAGLTLLLGACANPATPSYDAKFGESVRQAQALQTLNPDAGKNADPVTGIDGEAGKAAIDRYQESFRTPPKTIEVFNIGGGLSGQ